MLGGAKGSEAVVPVLHEETRPASTVAVLQHAELKDSTRSLSETDARRLLQVAADRIRNKKKILEEATTVEQLLRDFTERITEPWFLILPGTKRLAYWDG